MPDARQVAGGVPVAARRSALLDRGCARPGGLPLSGHLVAVTPAEFANWLDPLGPFEPAPHLAVACSGGGDSLALAMLAHGWARARGGTSLALIVDHGLRARSAGEADWTRRTLAARGIASRLLLLEGLAPGPRLAERARRARYAVLESMCAELGIVHLLLGHHAADQAETVAMRMLRGSGPDGLAGMAALVETPWVRLLRPLLVVPPGRLRTTLRDAGLQWIEDPSNRDPASLRARLRALRRDPDGAGPVTAAAVRAATARGQARRRREDATAAWLGRHARLDPPGYAVLDALPPDSAPLSALLRIVAGRQRLPRQCAVEAWLAAPRAATLHGVIIRPAGRIARGDWLLCREPAAMAAGVAARAGAIWDGRFRLLPGGAGWQPGAVFGPAPVRTPSPLDRARAGGYADLAGARVCWWPPAPAAGGGFVPMAS